MYNRDDRHEDNMLEIKKGFHHFVTDWEQGERLEKYFDAAFASGLFKDHHKLLSAYSCLLLDGFMRGEIMAEEFTNAMFNMAIFWIRYKGFHELYSGKGN